MRWIDSILAQILHLQNQPVCFLGATGFILFMEIHNLDAFLSNSNQNKDT